MYFLLGVLTPIFLNLLLCVLVYTFVLVVVDGLVFS